MSNWWDAAPLAPSSMSPPPPRAGGNWWDSIPLAQVDPGSSFGAPPSGGNFRMAREGLAPMSASDAFVRGLPKGFMLNMADEATGAAAASPLPGADAMRRSGAPNFNALDVIAGGVRMGAEKLLPGVFGDAGGKRYDAAVANERAQDARAMADQPIANIAGSIAGGIANPIAQALPAAGFLPGMATGAGLGAAYGAGDGDGLRDRAFQAAKGGGVGALLGGPIGAVAGRFAGTGQRSGNPIVEAAGRLGVNVPKYIATDSTAVQRLAQAERNIPFAGDKIVNAYEGMKSGLTNAADNLASGLGRSDPQAAGARAADSVLDYVGPQLRVVSDRMYGTVDSLVAPNAQMAHPLSNTQAAVSQILARNVQSARPDNGAAISAIEDAVTRPGGLTYDGIKALRSRIGESTSDLLTKKIDKKEFDLLYGALTQDLRASAQTAGGAKAVSAFDRANAIHRMGMERKVALEKIVGASGDKSGEQVFDRMLSMAGSTARGDLVALQLARKAMGAEPWKEFTGTVVQRLGRDAEGVFTPDRFVTAWGKLSDRGKDVLFSGDQTIRRALDDMFTVSSAAKAGAKFGNPSGTAQNINFAGMGAAALSAPLTTAASLLGNRVVASILSAPATATSMARWSKAYNALVARPSMGALSIFQQSSKNFASTLGDRLGVVVNPMDFIKAMQSHPPARADDNQQN